MAFRSVELDGQRWLVLMLPGVRREDLTPAVTPVLHEHVARLPANPLTSKPGQPLVEQWFDALPLTDLRDRGLHLDRRSVCLRQPWQSDRSVLDSLAIRPLGRADAMVLWLRDAGRAAARCGLGTSGHHQALRDLDADVRRAVQMLRREGADPHVITLTHAALHQVDRSFDPVASFRLAMSGRLFRRTHFRIELSHARVRCDSMRDVATCRGILSREPFTNHGELWSAEKLDAHGLPRRPDELVFVPFERVALGPKGAKAASRFAPDEESKASVPWIEDPRAAISIEEIATGFAQRIRDSLRVIRQPTDAAQPAIADFPDLLSVLDEDVARILKLVTPD